ncbi:MAG: stage III sporulation protein AA [Bacillota bacterium]|nr:stage III sporulation protein AA [Bacillota bacterium]
MSEQALTQILPYLPPLLRQLLGGLDDEVWAELEEIRLKSQQPPLLRLHQGERLLSEYTVSSAELHKTLLLLAESSLYAFDEQLRRGYITLPGGHRVGLSGRAVLERGAIRALKEISSINIRIARHLSGVAAPLLPHLCDEAGAPRQSLLISPPQAGKTTLLRDIARIFADGDGVPPLRVGVVDERSELAATRGGVAALPLGLRADVLDGAPKGEGIALLLRSMSPQLLICDELGGVADAEALRDAANAGVRVIASAHGASAAELRRRPLLRSILEEGCFERLLILSRRSGPGTLEAVYDGQGRQLC